MPANSGFEQRVTGESVGAVEAGAGNFSGNVQVFEGCVAVDISGDAAAGVVGGGNNGNAVGGHVDTVAKAGGI